jgi:hypothetical protein
MTGATANVIFASDVTTLRATMANQVKEFKELVK